MTVKIVEKLEPFFMPLDAGQKIDFLYALDNIAEMLEDWKNDT